MNINLSGKKKGIEFGPATDEMQDTTTPELEPENNTTNSDKLEPNQSSNDSIIQNLSRLSEDELRVMAICITQFGTIPDPKVEEYLIQRNILSKRF